MTPIEAKSHDSDTMNADLFIPDIACKFILLQRTDFIRFTKKRPYRFLVNRVPLITYERVVALEARVRRPEIKRQYRDCMNEEYGSIKDHLPERCATVLDIGCGLAGIDVLLDRHYAKQAPSFFLLDRTHVEEDVFYMFEDKGAFYNSLELTEQVLAANGVDDARVHLLDATDGNDIPIAGQVDLALSLLSWGFHYPVATYLNTVYELLNDGGCVIIDVRKGTDGLDLLANKFGEYVILHEKRNHLRVCARRGCR